MHVESYERCIETGHVFIREHGEYGFLSNGAMCSYMHTAILRGGGMVSWEKLYGRALRTFLSVNWQKNHSGPLWQMPLFGLAVKVLTWKGHTGFVSPPRINERFVAHRGTPAGLIQLAKGDYVYYVSLHARTSFKKKSVCTDSLERSSRRRPV